jgi:hypothetical protein
MFEHLRQGHTLCLRRRLSQQTGDRERATTSSGNRVNRGGSYQNPAQNARAANLHHNAPAIHNNNLCVRPAKRSNPVGRTGLGMTLRADG